MAVSAVPALIDALVAQTSAALPNALVFDGQGVTDNPGDFLMIGVDDPNTTDFAHSSDSQQDPATMATTRPRDEKGSIYCSALSWNGAGDVKAARDAAYATTEVVASICRGGGANLGMNNVRALVYGANKSDAHMQADTGAIWIVSFSISFIARI